MRKSNLKNIIIGLLPLILANIYLIISSFGHNDFVTPILISNNILVQCIYLIFLGYAVATDDKLTKIEKNIVEDISVRVSGQTSSFSSREEAIAFCKAEYIKCIQENKDASPYRKVIDQLNAGWTICDDTFDISSERTSISEKVEQENEEKADKNDSDNISSKTEEVTVNDENEENKIEEIKEKIAEEKEVDEPVEESKEKVKEDTTEEVVEEENEKEK